MPSAQIKVDIIVPVYKGLAAVKDCLESLFASEISTPNEIVVIWDCGPDPALRSYLLELRKQRDFTYLENPENLGFVKTVNRGMRLHTERNVVLLNGDTVVANDWLDRMVDAVSTDAKIASITPFSNNAEICSFPDICVDNRLPKGWSVKDLDDAFAKNVTPALIDIPTGVGFCMLIPRAALNEVGLFDEAAFPRGYGEENDFCRRAAALGYRNVHCTNVFVYHAGGISFGTEKKSLAVSGMHVLDRRYPEYRSLVHQFILNDPTKPYRLQACLAMLRTSENPVVLLHTHNLGGGIERYVEDLKTYFEHKLLFLVMRSITDSRLELCLPWTELRLYFDLPADLDLLRQLVLDAGVARLHLQHIMGIEASAAALLDRLNLPYDITLHDYFFINGNPTLTNNKGHFLPPGKGFDANCQQRYRVPLGMSVEQWRHYAAKILAGAERVIVPSQIVADLHAYYFSSINYEIAEHPASELEQKSSTIFVPPVLSGEKMRVAILGALSLEKGADILDEVAKLARRKKLPIEFHLIGYAYRPLEDDVITHGAYLESELDGLIGKLNPHCVWFPCLCPETYSYTLSACLRLGLPVIAPHIGAFPERLQGRPVTHVAAMSRVADEWLKELNNYLETQIKSIATQQHEWMLKDSQKHSQAPHFYAADYAEPLQKRQVSAGTLIKIDDLNKLLENGSQDVFSRKQRHVALNILFRLRCMPVARQLASLVPIEWQRKVKRRLSARPLHEIVR